MSGTIAFIGLGNMGAHFRLPDDYDRHPLGDL